MANQLLWLVVKILTAYVLPHFPPCPFLLEMTECLIGWLLAQDLSLLLSLVTWLGRHF